MERQLSVIIKPTNECNLSCKYCYVEENAEKGKISKKILEESIKKVSDFAKKSHWIWHGGEPLLMGLDFFRLVKNIQDFYRKKGKRFSNGIQTNGTLISEDLLNFANQTKDFHIGTSIDGPKEINDKTRVYKNGAGSFEGIMKGLNLAKEYRVGGGAICVVNSKNIKHPERLYNFFKSKKINVKFNPLVKSGKANKNFEEFGITPKDYGNFLSKLWDIYDEDCKKEKHVIIDIDPFMEVIGNLATGIPLGCNYSESCGKEFISINPLGDIYPCGRFEGVKDFWMGNISKNSIEEIFETEIHKKLGKRNSLIKECKKCNYQNVCNSGCMDNAYSNGGNIFKKDPYCIAYKTIFSKMESLLKNQKEVKQKCRNP